MSYKVGQLLKNCWKNDLWMIIQQRRIGFQTLYTIIKQNTGSYKEIQSEDILDGFFEVVK